MQTSNGTRRNRSGGILLLALCCVTPAAWADCVNGDPAQQACTEAEDNHEQLLASEFSDLRFNLPEPAMPGSSEQGETPDSGVSNAWNHDGGLGFRFFLGKVAMLQSDGSVAVGRDPRSPKYSAPRRELPSTVPRADARALEVDLGVSYLGRGGFSSSVGFAENLGESNADPGLVGWFRFRF